MSETDVGGRAVKHQETEDYACWQLIKESFDPCTYEQFAARFPNSPHASAACLKSATMIRVCNDWTQLERFLRDYGSSERIPLALSRLRELDLSRLGTQSGSMPLLRDKIQNSLSVRQQIRRLRSAFGPLGFYALAAATLLVIALHVLLSSGNGSPKALPGTLETDAEPSRELNLADRRSEDKDFRLALQAGTREALETYLLQNPKSFHAGDARLALEKLDDGAFGSAERAGTVQAYRDYMNAWPDGRNAAAGRAKISDLEASIEDDKSFEAAKNSDSKAAFESYLAAHPNGMHVAEVRHDLAQLDTAAYQAATKLNNPDAFRNYLQVWPRGQHSAAAELYISELESALEAYLSSHPQGRPAPEGAGELDGAAAMANGRLSELGEARLADDQAFKAAKEKNTREALEGYLTSNAHWVHTGEAQESLDALDATAYETAEGANTEQSYQEYLGAWPNGRHTALANVRLSELGEARIADDQAFKAATEKNTKEALEGYLTFNAHGFHTREAQESLDSLEATAYETAEGGNTEQSYQEYLGAWPNGPHTAMANVRLSALKEARIADDQAFKAAKEKNTKEALEGYLTSNAHGVHKREAQESLDALEATVYESAEGANTEQSYQDYLGAWPNGRHTAMANVRLSELKEARIADDQAFNAAKEKNTKAALEGYLTSNAHGAHKREAQENLDALEASAYKAAERADSIRAYEGYLATWTQGIHRAAANKRLSEARTAADNESFKAAKRINTREALEGYLAAYPKGVHAREVRDAPNRIGWVAHERPSALAEQSGADAGAGSMQANNKPSTIEKPAGQKNGGIPKKRPDPDEYSKYIFEARTFRAGETYSKQTRHGRLICEAFKDSNGVTRSRCRWDQTTIP